jgi:hypothetical protein
MCVALEHLVSTSGLNQRNAVRHDRLDAARCPVG